MRNLLSRVIGETYSLELEADVDVGPIFADRGQLEQVIMNLVVNARDAMPDGGTITVCTERCEDRPENAIHEDVTSDGPFTAIHVRDNGHGMPPETVARIFEPFFTTKEVGKGTGLGLSTVYGIVVQNRGMLAIDTAVGRGTQVSVFLAEAREGYAEPSRLPPREKPSARAVTYCLVVEDDSIVRRLLERTLLRAGFKVVTARDSIEALRVLQESPKVDLLVTDMMLPGTSGADLIAQAKLSLPDIKTVLISGYSSEDLELPADYAFLEKPFTPDDLVATLREFYG